VLVMAKAPIPGLAKTRLAADLGGEAAATLAAAALLDTLDTVESVTSAGDRLISLTGDLRAAASSDELLARLTQWNVRPQRGATFARRLVSAHHDAADLWGDGRLVVQIGTDTPGLTAGDLAALAEAASGRRRVGLGPATDGGWWGLATRWVGYVEGLVDVPMSTPATARHTRAAIEARGAIVSEVHALRDVDDLADAYAASRQAPETRFARRFAELGLTAGAA
jgi:uncharacterized protein